MFISLCTSTKNPIGSYNSPVVPRIGEHVHLTDATPVGVLLRVTQVFYHAQNTDQASSSVELEVTAANDAGREYLGRMLYQIAS
jgi:hypothetical protein